jgi:hypothetical protein
MDQVYLRSSKYQLVVSFFHRVLSWLHQIWRLLTERNVSLQENGWRHRSRQLNRHQKIILTRECSVCEWMAGHISLCCHDRASRAEWQAHIRGSVHWALQLFAKPRERWNVGYMLSDLVIIIAPHPSTVFVIESQAVIIDCCHGYDGGWAICETGDGVEKDVGHRSCNTT